MRQILVLFLFLFLVKDTLSHTQKKNKLKNLNDFLRNAMYIYLNMIRNQDIILTYMCS